VTSVLKPSAELGLVELLPDLWSPLIASCKHTDQLAEDILQMMDRETVLGSIVG